MFAISLSFLLVCCKTESRPELVAKFTCFNLSSKLMPANLLILGVVINPVTLGIFRVFFTLLLVAFVLKTAVVTKPPTCGILNIFC